MIIGRYGRKDFASFLVGFSLAMAVMAGGCTRTARLALTLAPSPHPSRPTATLTQRPTRTPSPTSAPAPMPTETVTPTSSPTFTPSRTATISPSPTISATPTFAFPEVTILMQANCRYGPGTAYLYSHGLYAEDRGWVHGRNDSGTWLWIQPENLDRHCWAAASVMEVVGDVFSVVIFQSQLPFTTFIGPPSNVQASRVGDQVTVTWNAVNVNPPEDSRGYLLEVQVCQGGLLVPLAVHTEGTSSTFLDEGSCGRPSSGLLYAVEKHGYTHPVPIPWP